MYFNESDVGTAIREKIAEGVIKREDVFVVTKVFKLFVYRCFNFSKLTFRYGVISIIPVEWKGYSKSH